MVDKPKPPPGKKLTGAPPPAAAKKPKAGQAAGKVGTEAGQAGAAQREIPVTLHDEFFRDRAPTMIILLILLTAIMSIYLFIVIYRFGHRPQPVYFESRRLEISTDESAGEKVRTYRLLHPVPLDQPYATTSELFIWLSQAISDTFSFNFQNTDEQMTRIKDYFTPDGWTQFSKALADANLLDQVKRGRFIVNARAVSPPLLKRQGVYKDRFEWHVQLEMYIRYRSSLSDSRQRWTMTVVAVRAPVTDKHNRGVAIDYFQVEDVRSTI